jgi:hypothetical protein
MYMVAIKDMQMPSCCMNCGLLGKDEMYCSIYPRKDLDIITVATTRPNWCPLVEIVTCKDCMYYRNGLSHCTQWVMTTNEDFYCADAERKE